MKKRMHWLGWLITLLAFVEGGWLAFDGSHALIKGNYITPKSGQYAGQLGPWSKLVEAVGLQPRSTTVMVIHVVIGAAWLVAIAGFVLRARWAWWAMVICASAGLWYLPFGMLLSVIQIVLLLLPVCRTST